MGLSLDFFTNYACSLNDQYCPPKCGCGCAEGLGCALLLSITGLEGSILVRTMTNSSSVFPLDGNCQSEPCKRGDVIICDQNDLTRVGNKNYHKGCEPVPEEGPLGTEPTSN